MVVSMFEATPQDIRDAAFGITIPAGADVDAQLTRLIAKARERLLNRFPNLVERVAAGRPSEALVKGILEDMVLRVVKNPKAYRSLGLDDFQVTIDTAVSAGALYLTDDELAALAPQENPGGRVRSARLHLPAWRVPRVGD